MIFATAPFIGALVAWGVLGEAATTSQFIAAGLAIAGVVVSLDSAHEHEHEHSTVEHDHEHSHDSHHEHSHHEHSSSTRFDQTNDPVREETERLVAAGQRQHQRHSHGHVHEVLRHSHPHVPDLHHRHEHEG